MVEFQYEYDENQIRLADKLKYIYDSNIDKISVEQNAQDLWNDYAKYNKDARTPYIKMHEPGQIKSKYVSRLAVHAMKYAIIHCISRSFGMDGVSGLIPENEDMDVILNQTYIKQGLQVTKYDVEYGIGRAETHYMYYEKIIRKLPSSTRTEAIRVNEGLQMLIWNYLHIDCPDNSATIDEINAFLNLDDSDATRRACESLVTKKSIFKCKQKDINNLEPEMIARHELKDGLVTRVIYSAKPFKFVE